MQILAGVDDATETKDEKEKGCSMIIRQILAVLFAAGLLTMANARADILSTFPSFLTQELDYIETIHVSQSFDTGDVSWNTITGDYSITAGDTSSSESVRGADGQYLRVKGEECNNIFLPNDCEPSEGVHIDVDVENIAGNADVYRLNVLLDVVAEGDIDDSFEWRAPSGSTFTWHAGMLEPACIKFKNELSDECVEFAEDPVLDYSEGQVSTWSNNFWMTNVIDGPYLHPTDIFSQDFFQ